MRSSRSASKAFLEALMKDRQRRQEQFGIKGTAKRELVTKGKLNTPKPKRKSIASIVKSFDYTDALLRATAILLLPPKKAHIDRREPEGRLVVRLALPLELCLPQNRKKGLPKFMFAQIRAGILQLYGAQLNHQLPIRPLPGRPVVQCIRFSSSQPDAGADSFKTAIDVLTPSRVRKANGVPHKVPGIGLIADDNPDACDARQRWEYAPPGQSMAIVEVWTGAQ
jgi:hypothetical protein